MAGDRGMGSAEVLPLMPVERQRGAARRWRVPAQGEPLSSTPLRRERSKTQHRAGSGCQTGTHGQRLSVSGRTVAGQAGAASALPRPASSHPADTAPSLAKCPSTVRRPYRPGKDARSTRQSMHSVIHNNVDALRSPRWGRQFSSILSAAMNASCGISTWPNWRMRFLPRFCFSSSLRFLVMSPP